MLDITTEEARTLMEAAKSGELTLLDVRQPWEYEEEHLPGALNIPLPELPARLSEVSSREPVLVYCRTGGRSRGASMLLESSGFDAVHNMLGGMMSWRGGAAIGPVESGLELMLSAKDEEDALHRAYAMELFLQKVYLRFHDAAEDEDAAAVYDRLARFEDGHMVSLYERYQRLAKPPIPREEFHATAVLVAGEGGVDPDAFLQKQGAQL